VRKANVSRGLRTFGWRLATTMHWVSATAKGRSMPEDIAAEFAQVPTCRRIVFETGRMAQLLYHGLR